MVTILHKPDLVYLPRDTPLEVKAIITELINTLDSEYGADRKLTDDGGYVLYLTKNDNIEEALKEIDIDLGKNAPEYMDIIGEYISVLFLFNNEYGVNVFMPKKVAPQSWLDEIAS